MSDLDPVKIRMDLSRGHWSLGEFDAALECLERAATEDPERPGMSELLEALLEDAGAGAPPEVVQQIKTVLHVVVSVPRDAVVLPSPLATGTMAGLLAEQGHEDQARAVTEDVLRRNPEDEIALAVRSKLDPDDGSQKRRIVLELERWLRNARRPLQGDLP